MISRRKKNESSRGWENIKTYERNKCSCKNGKNEASEDPRRGEKVTLALTSTLDIIAEFSFMFTNAQIIKKKEVGGGSQNQTVLEHQESNARK